MTETLRTWPLVRVVGAPDPGAGIRYDFNDKDADAERRVANLSLGAPTFDGDPRSLGAVYGYRAPVVTQRIKGSKLDALAAQGQLWRELLRSGNWLMVQLADEAKPFWLKTYPTDLPVLSLDRVYVDTASGDPVALPDAWEFDVPFLADAFGVEDWVTLGPYTVTQSPDGDYPMRIVLPPINGDAQTGLRVEVDPEDSAWSWQVSTISGSSLAYPFVDIGPTDGFTPHNGFSVGTFDSDYFGGSYRFGSVPGDDFLQVLTGEFPAVPTGRYSVWLRLTNDSVDDGTLLLGLDRNLTSGVPLVGKTVSVPLASTDSGRQRWVFLGAFQFPPGVVLPEDVTDSPGVVDFALNMGTPDAADVYLEGFLLVPMDGRNVSAARTLRLDGPAGAPLGGGSVGTFDGDDELYWVRDSGSGELVSCVPAIDGGFPMADPAVEENVLYVMAIDNQGGAATNVGAESTVTVSYRPRKLHF